MFQPVHALANRAGAVVFWHVTYRIEMLWSPYNCRAIGCPYYFMGPLGGLQYNHPCRLIPSPGEQERC